jgi:hypothetical protein
MKKTNNLPFEIRKKGTSNEELSTQLAQIATDVNDIVTIKPNGTNDTTNIQNALNSGKRVMLSSGTFLISKLTLPSNSLLLGSGKSTIIKSINNNTNTSYLIDTVDKAYNVMIDSFVLDGNKTNNSNIFGGIHIVCTNNTGLVQFDVMNNVKDIYIKSLTGNGFELDQYCRGCLLDNVVVYSANGIGFWVKGTDNILSNCVAGTIGKEGIYFDTSSASNKLIGCKSFLAGNITPNCSGFLLKGYNHNIVGCEVQQNNYNGIEVTGNNTIVSGTNTSNNGCIGTDSSAMKITGSYNSVEVTITSDGIDSKQKYGIYLDVKSCANNVRAIIKELFLPTTPTTLPSMILINDYNNFTNNVIINGEDIGNFTVNPLDLTTGITFSSDATGSHSVVDNVITVNTSNYSSLAFDWGSKVIKSIPTGELTGKKVLVMKAKCKTSTKELLAGMRALINGSFYSSSGVAGLGKTDSSEYRTVFLVVDLAAIGAITNCQIYFYSFKNNGATVVNNTTATFKDIVYTVI